MLRLLVLLLLVANLAWWAWHWPPLAQSLGLAADRDRDPQRLNRQVLADRIRLVAASAGASSAPEGPGAAGASPAASGVASTVAEPPAQCLEIGPLGDTAYANTRRELLQAGLATDAWVDIRRERPGSFALYMGRFADLEQMRHKAEELQRLGIAHEALGPNAPAALSPGLTLGRYASAELAQARLQQLQNRGVRTARVLTLSPPEAEHTLRLEQASGALQARLLAPTAPASAPTAGWRRCEGR